MFSYVISCKGVGFVSEYLEKVELGGGIVVCEVVSLYGTIELLGEDFVFDYVFGYFVGVGTVLWFGGDTP